MPFPQPDDPDYCPGSNTLPAEYDPTKLWHRCPSCSRPIATRPKAKTFFPHVNNRKRARRNDDVQETLMFYGHDRRDPPVTVSYADPEPDA